MDFLNTIAVSVGCAAVAEDLARGRISNWTSAAALIGGICCHGVRNGWSGIATALLGAAAGFGIFFLLYVAGGMGGGDVKLLAGFGSLLGPGAVSGAAFLAAIFGAIVASAVWATGTLFPGRKVCALRSIPYAPAITVGALLVLFGKT